LSKMVFVLALLSLYYMRAAAMLHYAVLPIIVSTIKSHLMLQMLITVAVILAGALALIPYAVNPPAPPYSVTLLFRQVRNRVGLPKALTNIFPVQLGKQNAKVYLNRGAI